MGSIVGAASNIIGRAADDPDFHAELTSKPREVLERELDRPLSDEELQMAADELKKHGIHVQLSGAVDDSARRLP
jgi:hypothetical protein